MSGGGKPKVDAESPESGGDSSPLMLQLFLFERVSSLVFSTFRFLSKQICTELMAADDYLN